ncbi:hypothetical protein FPRO04_05462 [Fusarium proliferatum]|nr:hypothetical protein FPRO04_05462 [Fusarium proliferatum]
MMRLANVESPWPSMVVDSWAQGASNNSSHHGHSGKPGDKIQEWSSLIGIVTAIVGNVLIALALNVQRYAHIRLHKQRSRNRKRAKEALKHPHPGDHGGSYGTIGGVSDGAGYQNGHGTSTNDGDRMDESRETDPLTGSFHSEASQSTDSKEDDTSSSYLKSPYWWLGQVLITLGEMGNFLAYGFAPASIVSPLGVVALISNCIIAPAMFHEKFRQRDFWGVVIAVGGVVTVVLSAKQEETKLNPHDVWDAITALAFEIYLGVTIFLILVLMWASPRYGRRTILIDLGLVGLFGGYTALATKGVSSMLSSTLWRAFATPVTYILIVILLGTAVMQIRYVNKALQRFDSTQVIPIQFVMFTLCVIIGSAVLYRDFERTNAEQAAKFVGGCLLTFFGVFLITSGREQSHDDDEVLSEDDDFEDTIGLASQEGNGTASYQDGQGFSTPKSQSRRSSHLSGLNYPDTQRVLKAAVTPHQDNNNLPSAKALSSQMSPGQEIMASGFPWNDFGGPSTPPGRGVRAYSTDSVLAPPGTAGSAAFASHPTTPMRDALAADGSLLPRPQASPSKPGGTGSRSRTFISPSPLSSTVTAVVKDAFLRASDDPSVRQSSMRRIRSTIRAGLFFNEDDENADPENNSRSNTLPAQSAAPVSVENLPGALDEAEGPVGEDDLVRRRSRSVSDTLGDFFGVRRKKRHDGYFASDVEDVTIGGATPGQDRTDRQGDCREV